MRYSKATVGSLVFVAYLSVPAAAAEEVQAAPSSQVVVIPFDPPLGTKMRYRVIKTVEGLQAQPRVEVLEDLKYEKSGDGYLLTIALVKATQDGRTYTPATGPVILADHLLNTIATPEDEIGLLSPVTLELNARGEVQRVHNWDQIQQAIRALPDKVAAKVPAGEARSQVRSMVESKYAPLATVSPEGPIGFAAREWPTMLGFNAKPFQLGEPMVVPGAIPIMGQAEPVLYSQTILVSRDPDETLSLKESQVYDRASFNAAVKRAQAANLAPQSASALDAYLRVAEIAVDFDAAGMISRGSWVVQFKDESDEPVQTTTNTFERLD